MKKLIGLLALVAITTSGQNFLSQSFLNVKTLMVGTNVNAGYTNINSVWLFPGATDAAQLASATNTMGRQWTNLANTAITNTQANATNYNTDTFNMFADVGLWAKRDGSTWTFDKLVNSSSTVNVWSTTNFVVPQETLLYDSSPAKIVIKVGGRTVDNASTVNFVFTPLPDGVNEPYNRLSDWTVGVALPLATNTVVITNVPMYMYNGCAKLRLRSVTPGAAAFNGATTTNLPIYSVTLNGFVP